MPCHAGPELVAQVIHDVSGLSHWKVEAAAAVSELERTRAALENIFSNVRRLVSMPEVVLACKIMMTCKAFPFVKWMQCPLQEAAVAADHANCAALAALDAQTAQLADTSQQLAATIVACREAAGTKLTDLHTEAGYIQVVHCLASLCTTVV